MSKNQNMTWLEAILKVLENSKSPMHYTKIWDTIRDKHYLDCGTNCNPEITVNNYIRANKNLIIPFGNKGCYILKRHLDTGMKSYLEATVPSTPQSVIRAYGIRWNRAKFAQNNYTMLGVHTKCKNISPVDFSKERGIYVLYNGYKIVYIGQANYTLSARLKQHALNSTNWDTFSWFGIDEVLPNGQICKEKVFSISSKTLIDTFEAALILASNPSNNKTRGNHVRGQEYHQI